MLPRLIHSIIIHLPKGYHGFYMLFFYKLCHFVYVKLMLKYDPGVIALKLTKILKFTGRKKFM